ncbi:uncharacterized protein M421DRAFT_58158 [Didymella exigua CBS 183.55]|uniref:DUF7514 domain-containing protein n=1 Tax=Didymella exigua CBS 183.55 TaxID=1150837 RepID=A0A6A5RT14_9PLEO|nr:uncharacterized protein M421DRAFT_58158 [Didymella exigua CBS 183.55]KAF1930603.1 hypothetical protein M421DRAFT_58158 [Didymella exigua CBS 183.55]
MATATQETREQPPPERTANDEAARREAYDYWGYLLRTDKCGTPMLDRLLKGVAEVISKKFEPSDSPDLTPSQIAAWYRAVGGNYDMLFTETAPSSIAFIYRALGAFHSLQPSASDDGYSSPAVPALKKQGFVTWQTIQLLLGPQEHVPFLQKSVEQFDVIDPDTKQPFLKILPSECFPDKPDEAMEEWYEGVATRLRREADEEATGVRAEKEPRGAADLSGDGSSADERTGAFKYFEDPMYRKARPRPTYMRHVSKEQARANNDGPIARVRHMLNPWARRRSLPPGRYEDDSLSDEDATPVAPNPNQRYPTHKRPHPPRRESSLSTTDSDSDPDQPPSRQRTPVLRHHRSHEQQAVSPREYFPAYHEQHRPLAPQRLSNERLDARTSSAPSPVPIYGPTKSPLFATTVAQQMQARNHYDRPLMTARGSYRPVPAPNVRYASHSTSVSPQHANPPYARDHDRYGHGDRDTSYEGSSNHGSSQSHRRHSSTGDAMYPRERYERDRERDGARTRSHDRVQDEWDEGERDRSRGKRNYDRSREHSRERERDRHRASHRYVAGVEGGVSGRRYPVMSANPSY